MNAPKTVPRTGSRSLSGDSGVKPKALTLTVRVPTEDLSYPIRIGPGVLARLGREVAHAQDGVGKVAVITDTNVGPLHAAAARESLEAEGFTVSVHVVPAGESHKTPEQLVALVGELVEAGLSRRDLVVTLGGGVVGDMGGLAAALFMRGVSVVQCPTSLLAQVDASVGGKVAVDLGTGKNLLGTFHFPRAVVIDTSLLSTLPAEERSSGLAEMVKHALLFDREHLEQLLAAAEAIERYDASVLAPLVAHSVALKAACVSRDPMELSSSGKGRVLLNFGHTLGHAIEHASRYGLRHGEAVAMGIVAAARLSERKGVAAPGFETRIVDVLTRLGLPTELDPWLTGEQGKAVARAMSRDKKRAADKVTYIALADVGEPSTLPLPVPEILSLLRPQSAG